MYRSSIYYYIYLKLPKLSLAGAIKGNVSENVLSTVLYTYFF